jgi:UDP-3-O-[3-hydroxymyristoyl] glucosamine N-acyltransferase
MKFPAPVRLSEVAEFLGATYIGDSEFPVRGLNEIHMVEPGDITFCDHPKYFKKALSSAADVCLLNALPDENPLNKQLLISEDPFRDFNRLILHFKPESQPHSSLPASSHIGENTYIAPGVVIGERVTIGKNCTIHPNVVLYQDTHIGNNVIIHAGSIIGADAFYFRRRPDSYDKFHSCGSVIIGNHVEIGALCTIDRGVTGDTIIGDYTKFDDQVHIGHDTKIGKRVLMAAQCAVAGVCTIEDDVILWGQVGVTKEVTIGRGAQVLARSGVMTNLEAGKKYLGNPTSEAFAKNREWAILKKLPEIYQHFIKTSK